MKKTLSVAAIENGTVIDHIPLGQGLRIVRLLKLAEHKKKVTLGLNLPSLSIGYKDLIKVEGREVSQEEANQIAIFAPQATITIIRNFEIEEKFVVTMPATISTILCCPNSRCVTNHERIQTCFQVNQHGSKVQLECQYCEKGFAHDLY